MSAKHEESGHSSVPTAELLAAAAASPALQAAIQAADANNDGALSVPEIVQVITSQARAEADRRRMRRVAVVLGAILLVMLAGNAALTYCVVALSKETSTGSDGVMVVKGSEGQVVQTATYTETAADWQRLLYATPGNASTLQSISVPTPTGGFTYFQVAGAEVEPGQRAVLHSPWGARLTITPAGIAELEPAPACGAPAGEGASAGNGTAGARRRLLANAANAFITVAPTNTAPPVTGGTAPYVGGSSAGAGVSTGVFGAGGVTGSVSGAGVGGGGASVALLETPLDKALNRGLETLAVPELAQIPSADLAWLLSLPAGCASVAKLSVDQLKALSPAQVAVLPAACLTPAGGVAAAANNVCGASPLAAVLRGGWTAAQRAQLPAAVLKTVLGTGWAANPANVLANLFYDNCRPPKTRNAPTDNPFMPRATGCGQCTHADCQARAWLVQGASAAQIKAHVPTSLKPCFAAGSAYFAALGAAQKRALEQIPGWKPALAVMPVGQPAGR